MSAPNSKPALSSVIRGDTGTCLGFLLRTATGVKAFGPDEILIGVYSDEAAAIAAIFQPDTLTRPREPR
jgi:hypothetical protein